MILPKEHDTGKGFAIRAGRGYVGADGETRYALLIGRPGNGYSVMWSRTHKTYWALIEDRADEKRPHAESMPMSKFIKWAQSEAAQ